MFLRNERLNRMQSLILDASGSRSASITFGASASSDRRLRRKSRSSWKSSSLVEDVTRLARIEDLPVHGSLVERVANDGPALGVWLDFGRAHRGRQEHRGEQEDRKD